MLPEINDTDVRAILNVISQALPMIASTKRVDLSVGNFTICVYWVGAIIRIDVKLQNRGQNAQTEN